MKIPLFITGCLLISLFPGCTYTPASKEDIAGVPKNIILFIGDGMGVTQISSGIFAQDSPLHFERFKHIGFIKTSSSSHKKTDSAAAATALACGKKTYNGAVGVDQDTVEAPSILVKVKALEKSSGLVATSTITHATPACFFSHQPSRQLHEAIAMDMLDSPVDLFIGGGLKYFAERSDGISLIDSLEARGFEVFTDSLPSRKTSGKLAVFIASISPPKYSAGRGDLLPKATDLAIKQLNENEKGFFLMAEGSQIDWGGHANDADYLTAELLDFDRAIGIALDFAELDGNTLVVVTADHETGGFALSGKEGVRDELEGTFTTAGHTAAMVPVFAFGPGAENFQGIYENTGIYHKMEALLQSRQKH